MDISKSLSSRMQITHRFRFPIFLVRCFGLSQAESAKSSGTLLWFRPETGRNIYDEYESNFKFGLNYDTIIDVKDNNLLKQH